MDGKVKSFSAKLNTMRTSLSFVKSRKSIKRGNGVIDGKDNMENLHLAAFQTISSDLIKRVGWIYC